MDIWEIEITYNDTVFVGAYKIRKILDYRKKV